MNARTKVLAVVLALQCAAFADAATWEAGLDLTMEAGFGLKGEARGGETLHGTALAYAAWDGSGGDATPVAWSAYVSGLGVAGHGPTERFIGDFLAASNIEAYPSARLYTWWIQAGSGNWSLRAGALLADEEFAGTDGGGGLLNSAFGWPAFISANTVNAGPAYFVAAPGVRIDHTWGECNVWRFGIYDGDSFDSTEGDPRPTRHGLHYGLGGDQGWFLITEASFGTAGGRANLKGGAWFHTAEFADVRDDSDGRPFAISGNDPRSHGSNHGFFAAAEFALVGESGEPGSVTVFVRGGFSPSDRNAVSHAFDAGIAWTGPIHARPADSMSVGLTRANFSNRYSEGAVLADPAIAAPDHEQVIEASYTLQLSERFSIQPDLQYIFHTGGSAAQRDAAVFLLRVNSSF